MDEQVDELQIFFYLSAGIILDDLEEDVVEMNWLHFGKEFFIVLQDKAQKLWSFHVEFFQLRFEVIYKPYIFSSDFFNPLDGVDGEV